MLLNGNDPAPGDSDITPGVQILRWIDNGPVLDNKVVGQKDLSELAIRPKCLKYLA
jgi:hypothetical protein